MKLEDIKTFTLLKQTETLYFEDANDEGSNYVVIDTKTTHPNLKFHIMEGTLEIVEIWDERDPEGFKKITDTKDIITNKGGVYGVAFFVEETHQLRLFHIEFTKITKDSLIGKRHYPTKYGLRTHSKLVDDFIMKV